MVPILFERKAVNFDSNGICRLPSCLFCEVTEERNGIYECDFQYPVTGVNFEEIQPGRIIYVPHDSTGVPQPFRIVNYTSDLAGVYTFHAVHISYDLSRYVVRIKRADADDPATLEWWFEHLQHNARPASHFTFHTEDDYHVNIIRSAEVPITVKSFLGEEGILGAFPGEYEWDKFRVYFHTRRGKIRDFTVRYGLNLTSFREEYDQTEAFNAVYPYFYKDNGEDGSIYLSPGMVVSESIPHEAPIKCVPLDLSDRFTEDYVPTTAELTSRAKGYLNNHDTDAPRMTLDVSFVQLADTDEFEEFEELFECQLCDIINVEIPSKFTRNASARYEIVKTVYDALRDRYKELQLGMPNITLAQALGIEHIQPSGR